MKFLYTTLAASLLAFSLIACDDDDDNDTDDGGVNTDATSDASTTDGGTTSDASSTSDASTSDASISDGGTSSDGPANDLCKDAARLALGETLSGTTVKAHGEVDSVEGEGSLDVYYKVTVATKGHYKLALTPSVKNTRPYIELWKSCAPIDAKISLDHEDYVASDYNDNEDGSPVEIVKELEPGDYILRVELQIEEDEDSEGSDKEAAPLEGSDFTVSFNQYTPTLPVITSVKASVQRAEGSSDFSIVALRINGQDEGKDIEEIQFSLLDDQGKVVKAEGAEKRTNQLKPKYDADGRFEDAFTSYSPIDGTISAAAVSIKMKLIDKYGFEGEEKTATLDENFSKLERSKGQTCDLYDGATYCSDCLRCYSDDSHAFVCQTDFTSISCQ